MNKPIISHPPDEDPHDLGRLQDLAHGPHQRPVHARERAAVEGVGLVEDDAHLGGCVLGLVWGVLGLDGCTVLARRLQVEMFYNCTWRHT